MVSAKVNGINAELLEMKDRELLVKVDPSNVVADGIFLGGNGLRYQRYDLSTVSPGCSEFKTKLDTTTEYDGFLVEDRFMSEPKTGNSYGIQYGQVFKGFFKAPATTNYKFYLYSDDSS